MVCYRIADGFACGQLPLASMIPDPSTAGPSSTGVLSDSEHRRAIYDILMNLGIEKESHRQFIIEYVCAIEQVLEDENLKLRRQMEEAREVLKNAEHALEVNPKHGRIIAFRMIRMFLSRLPS